MSLNKLTIVLVKFRFFDIAGNPPSALQDYSLSKIMNYTFMGYCKETDFCHERDVKRKGFTFKYFI